MIGTLVGALDSWPNQILSKIYLGLRCSHRKSSSSQVYTAHQTHLYTACLVENINRDPKRPIISRSLSLETRMRIVVCIHCVDRVCIITYYLNRMISIHIILVSLSDYLASIGRLEIDA